MMKYLHLIRPKHWVKNLFLFIPLFFSGEIFAFDKIEKLIYGFIAFSLVASSIYIINDYKDREKDAKHPTKKNRPLAAGTISPAFAITMSVVFAIAGFAIAYLIREKVLVILLIYFLLNLSYSLGLKDIAILDVMIIAAGFVLRVKAGAAISWTPLSQWLILMVFLLALFLALGKRRDDVMLQNSSGVGMRKSIHGYNLEFLNVSITLVCAVIIVCYLIYTILPGVEAKFHTYRLYYTSIFVIAGMMRYLQLIFVHDDSGYPTHVLYRDRFIQLVLALWAFSFFFLIYIKEFKLG
jgi:decaprenyl-phosphate phosphoribosyltransferase